MANSIGGVDLNTYGLRLMKIEDHLSLPPYKKILNEHSLPENLKVLEEKEIVVYLFGEYQTKILLGQYIEAFKTKIKSSVKQIWEFPNHSIYGYYVVKNGVQVSVYGTCVEIVIKLTETE
jgi:hypothetical protein